MEQVGLHFRESPDEVSIVFIQICEAQSKAMVFRFRKVGGIRSQICVCQGCVNTSVGFQLEECGRASELSVISQLGTGFTVHDHKLNI